MGSFYAPAPNNKKYPFLPPGHAQRWLSYVWLAYIFWFVFSGIAHAKSWGAWLVLVLGLAIFLPLYFAAFWVQGRKVLWIAAAECLLGTVCAPWNPGAAVFFVYAAAALTQLNSLKTTMWSLTGILLWIGLAAVQLQRSPEFWVSGILSAAFVGLISLWRIQECRARMRLELAQSEVERLAKIAERERIARDLHDLLGHTLSLIVLKSELASKFADIDPVRSATEIREVERISRDALAQVRAAVRGYCSAGFAAELAHAREALQTAGIQLHCDTEFAHLPPQQESVLALALREAVTNVVRHSSARSCQIRLGSANGGVELHISDDGKGSSAGEGFGLSGMRERNEAIGGTL
jgi:two-component system, NarL family, sensor histidine kinase DesK